MKLSLGSGYIDTRYIESAIQIGDNVEIRMASGEKHFIYCNQTVQEVAAGAFCSEKSAEELMSIILNPENDT